MLLTTAGMQQFKPYFMGLAEPPSTRMVSVQKCFRTSDIDKVGLTARHCTFFEMLGNFSIGDYFKEGAIRFAWEFSMDYLNFDPGLVWVSYFEGDDTIEADEEAVGLWRALGVPRRKDGGSASQRQFLGSGWQQRTVRTLLGALLRPGAGRWLWQSRLPAWLRLRSFR